MQFLFSCFQGILIGAGAILPGISSGVLCVVFGIYEKLLDAVLNFFKNIKKNFKFLFPIILGIGIGVLIFSNILNYVFYRYPLQVKSIFIGLIIGSIPSLLKEVNEKEKFKLRYLISLIFALLIGIIAVLLEKYITVSANENVSFIYLMISGLLMSVGIIVPGVSSTVILMLLGIYPIYLQSVATIYFPVLIPMGLGLILGSLICMKLTKFLLEKYYALTFYAIIGFSLGSIIVLLPNISLDFSVVIFVLCVILGIEITNFNN